MTKGRAKEATVARRPSGSIHSKSGAGRPACGSGRVSRRLTAARVDVCRDSVDGTSKATLNATARSPVAIAIRPARRNPTITSNESRPVLRGLLPVKGRVSNEPARKTGGPSYTSMTAIDGRSALSPILWLTTRELQVLDMVAIGATNGEIASRLDLSTRTVKWYLAGIFEKFGVVNRAHAVALANGIRS